MDRFDQMSVLVAVVDGGSFSAAGRALGMPLATVSRKVADLEANLGTRLLSRTTRQLALTEAGRTYVAACRQILERVEEAERVAAGEYAVPRGELVISAPIVFGRLHVLPVVSAFLAAYPEIRIRLALSDRVVDLVDDHVDIALRIGALGDSRLVARTVGIIRPVLCASPAYLGRSGRPADPDDLAGHAVVAFEGALSSTAWSFGEPPNQRRVTVAPRLVVNTAEAAIDAAIAGVGITRVLSYQVEAALRSGALECVLEAFAPAAWPVSLVHAGQGLAPRKLGAFMDFAAPRLKARLVEAARAGKPIDQT
ncbi:LysR family transcriptional regulator [Kaistia algarum]|uniref:LysR family transcriptional regulator n=1 Tax=Kaistia algarum TaxID=2083279 RepID=UPI000CE91872|nr:LysR family transcriptional regulator [Kaistia algarum]MCX5515802.1 LysR family transcriptional regulator [Kaistia algarum]PPE80824.1 LysR family transcriptional regulator [Kaistia algarum]